MVLDNNYMEEIIIEDEGSRHIISANFSLLIISPYIISLKVEKSTLAPLN